MGLQDLPKNKVRENKGFNLERLGFEFMGLERLGLSV